MGSYAPMSLPVLPPNDLHLYVYQRGQFSNLLTFSSGLFYYYRHPFPIPQLLPFFGFIISLCFTQLLQNIFITGISNLPPFSWFCPLSLIFRLRVLYFMAFGFPFSFLSFFLFVFFPIYEFNLELFLLIWKIND